MNKIEIKKIRTRIKSIIFGGLSIVGLYFIGQYSIDGLIIPAYNEGFEFGVYNWILLFFGISAFVQMSEALLIPNWKSNDEEEFAENTRILGNQIAGLFLVLWCAVHVTVTTTFL